MYGLNMSLSFRLITFKRYRMSGYNKLTAFICAYGDCKDLMDKEIEQQDMKTHTKDGFK